MPSGGVQVIGLRDFQRRIAKAASVQPREMRMGLNDVGQIIVDEVVPDMESMFVSDPSRLDGALEDSVRALSTTREGRVVAGYPKRVPYAGWWEFGGPRGKTRAYPGPPPRAFVKSGRTLYPALEKRELEIIARLEVVLNHLATIANEG